MVQAQDTDDRFFFNVHKMELERAKYMLKAYLRARIFKIERHLLYLVEKDQAHLLSEGEMEYAWRTYEGKKEHFQTSFLVKIPSQLNPFAKNSEEEAGGETVDERLITKPNEGEFVFVRFLKEYEVYQLNIDIEIKIIKDAVYFLPYKAVRELCERGEASLL